MMNMNCLHVLTIVIPWLRSLFIMANAVSSTIVLVNSETSDSVNLFIFAMCAFDSKCFPIEPVLCSGGWWSTWWWTINMKPGLPVSSIPQCKYNRHNGACLELCQAIGLFESSFIDPHQTSWMISKLRSLKLRMKTWWSLKEIVISINEVLKDLESHMGVVIWTQRNAGWETVRSYVIIEQNAGSQILTLELQATTMYDLWDIACIVVKLYTRIYWEDWPLKTEFRNDARKFVAV